MNTLDTRDLIDERDTAKQTILDAWNEQFEDKQVEEFEDINLTDESLDDYAVVAFQERWDNDFATIKEIDDLEDEVSSSEWEYGLFMVDEDDFEEYCEDELESCGYFPKDFPQWIKNNIDWEGIADDMKQDYSEVTFRGTTYLYRA